MVARYHRDRTAQHGAARGGAVGPCCSEATCRVGVVCLQVRDEGPRFRQRTAPPARNHRGIQPTWLPATTRQYRPMTTFVRFSHFPHPPAHPTQIINAHLSNASQVILRAATSRISVSSAASSRQRCPALQVSFTRGKCRLQVRCSVCGNGSAQDKQCEHACLVRLVQQQLQPPPQEDNQGDQLQTHAYPRLAASSRAVLRRCSSSSRTVEANVGCMYLRNANTTHSANHHSNSSSNFI